LGLLLQSLDHRCSTLAVVAVVLFLALVLLVAMAAAVQAALQ
jgi:hypothetical protein